MPGTGCRGHHRGRDSRTFIFRRSYPLVLSRELPGSCRNRPLSDHSGIARSSVALAPGVNLAARDIFGSGWDGERRTHRPLHGRWDQAIGILSMTVCAFSLSAPLLRCSPQKGSRRVRDHHAQWPATNRGGVSCGGERRNGQDCRGHPYLDNCSAFCGLRVQRIFQFGSDRLVEYAAPYARAGA